MNNHNIEREVKLTKLKDDFYNGEPVRYRVHRTRDYEGKEQVIINRQNVKEVIRGVLGIIDTHTVNGWIDYLVALGILEHNPTSQQTRHGYTKPSNDTRYYLHYEKCTPTHIATFGSTTKTAQEPDPTSEQGSEQSRLS